MTAEPTQFGDEVAAEMRAYFEAHKHEKWRDDGTADNLMLGLFNIAARALKATAPTPSGGDVESHETVETAPITSAGDGAQPDHPAALDTRSMGQLSMGCSEQPSSQAGDASDAPTKAGKSAGVSDVESLIEMGRMGKVKCPQLEPTLSERSLSSQEWREFGIAAADEIERLRAAITSHDAIILLRREIARLREALQPFADLAEEMERIGAQHSINPDAFRRLCQRHWDAMHGATDEIRVSAISKIIAGADE